MFTIVLVATTSNYNILRYDILASYSYWYYEYHKQRKIHWAKFSRIPLNGVFHGKKFRGALHLKHLNNAIWNLYSYYK